MSGFVASAVEYMMDAGQRSVLFLDVLRQRGDQYREHIAQTAPHVLQYAAELIIDGRKLDEPVNYALVRIIPPKDVEIDLDRRPFIVVDPRAGHGPGIGGVQGGQRNRRCDESGSSLLFHRLPARADARTNDRTRRTSRSGVYRESHQPPSGSRRQALRDRKLPGRLGRHDPGIAAAGIVRAYHRRRCAACVLGGRAWQKSDALFGWPARRKLANGTDERSWRRQIRRGLARAKL